MAKKLIAVILSVVCLFSLAMSAFAAEQKEEYPYSELDASVKQQLTEEEYNTLSEVAKRSVSKYGIPDPEEIMNLSNVSVASNGNVSTTAVTESYFIPNFGAFTFYTDGSFTQQDDVCVPVAMANAISYFDYMGRSNLISGSRMSQAEFTEICNLTGWVSGSGSNLVNGVNGLATYVSRRGYTATDYAYYLQNWSNLKKCLKGDYPVFVTQSNTDGNQGHINLAVGYKVENNNKLVYVYSGEANLPIMWLNFNEITMYDRIWIS